MAWLTSCFCREDRRWWVEESLVWCSRWGEKNGGIAVEGKADCCLLPFGRPGHTYGVRPRRAPSASRSLVCGSTEKRCKQEVPQSYKEWVLGFSTMRPSALAVVCRSPSAEASVGRKSLSVSSGQ